MYRVAPLLAAGYVGDVDPDAVTEVVDEAGQQLSALQNFLIDAAPSIRAFVFNLIIAVIIYIVGRKLIKLATRILEKFLGRTGMDAQKEAISRYVCRKSCPHCETQCASSTTSMLTCIAETTRRKDEPTSRSGAT